MGRREKNRKIGVPPLMMGYKPYGIQLCKSEKVILTFEEYESLRLVAYQMLLQDEAAVQMNVSRPTFTRIYNRAIKKIAQAFIEGSVIEFEGGSYTFDSDWYRCKRCYKVINGINNHKRCKNCNEYGNGELVKINI